MKRIAIIILCVFCFQAKAQVKPIMEKPKVDKRVELISIVFRLAGIKMDNYQSYTNKIDEYFNPYKDHELVFFTKEMVGEKGIGFDLLTMTVQIDEDLNLLIEPDKYPDPRWAKEDVEKYVKLLKQFYQDAKCEIFFNQNENLYTEVSKRFLPIYEAVDLNWFSSFFGRNPEEEFSIINGLALGGANYGSSLIVPNQKKKVYAIMGAWRVDSLNAEMPIFIKEEYFPILIHEFNHSFCNELIIQNEELFKNSGEELFKKVSIEMSTQGYNNWRTMLMEALVRASVIKYMKDHNFDESEVMAEISNQQNNKFLWITELVAELDNYSKNRDQYPTLESYIPRLVDAYKIWAENIK